jgi:hypothetical protein
MQALRLVHEDDESEVYEEEELEVCDEDIACAEPADGARPAVRMSYDRVNAFLGQYLATIRRGESMVVPAPRGLHHGDLLDVEIAIADLDRFVLHAQVLTRWPLAESDLAEVQFMAGRLTDRIVRPVVERALGARAAAQMLS